MRHHLLALLIASMACACAGQGGAGDARRPAARAADVQLPSELRVVAARVGAGATLASLLRGARIVEADVAAVVARAAAVFDLRKVRSAQPYRLEQTGGGALRRLEYEIDNDRLLRVTRSDPAAASFVAELVPIEKTRAVVVVRGAIDRRRTSLFAAMDAAGEGADLSIGLAGIFGGEIDFNADLQPQDRFELLVEKQFRDGDVFAGYGPILAAEFDNAGRRFRAVRYAPAGGEPGYFDERGVSMRRFFLRSPLKFEPTISSGFSRGRLHPILGEYRAHLGIDYLAPPGAPVIASAAGVVVAAGMAGDAGRMVQLRHANGFETEYLHLSSIAVRAGEHVKQGDLVGRVGSSGLATGPHLDYRMKKNGAFVNPLTAQRAMPPADPVPAVEQVAFTEARDRVFAALAAR